MDARMEIEMRGKFPLLSLVVTALFLIGSQPSAQAQDQQSNRVTARPVFPITSSDYCNACRCCYTAQVFDPVAAINSQSAEQLSKTLAIIPTSKASEASKVSGANLSEFQSTMMDERTCAIVPCKTDSSSKNTVDWEKIKANPDYVSSLHASGYLVFPLAANPP